jgi:hypothetical protein
VEWGLRGGVDEYEKQVKTPMESSPQQSKQKGEEVVRLFE